MKNTSGDKWTGTTVTRTTLWERERYRPNTGRPGCRHAPHFSASRRARRVTDHFLVSMRVVCIENPAIIGFQGARRTGGSSHCYRSAVRDDWSLGRDRHNLEHRYRGFDVRHPWTNTGPISSIVSSWTHRRLGPLWFARGRSKSSRLKRRLLVGCRMQFRDRLTPRGPRIRSTARLYPLSSALKRKR